MGMLLGTRRALLGGRGMTYTEKVLGYGPIAYWPLNEAAGVTAVDQVNSPAQDGDHVNVTLGQPGIGDGKTAPLYDGGGNDYTDIYSAVLVTAFDGAEGTVLTWAKVSDVGVWTDFSDRTVIHLAYNSTTDFVRIFRHTTNNQLRIGYKAGGGGGWVWIDGLSDVDWMPLAITWSKTADQVKAFKDGAQVGATLSGLGVWGGALDPTLTIIGEMNRDFHVSPWDGYIAHAAVWDRALAPEEMADLATV